MLGTRDTWHGVTSNTWTRGAAIRSSPGVSTERFVIGGSSTPKYSYRSLQELNTRLESREWRHRSYLRRVARPSASSGTSSAARPELSICRGRQRVNNWQCLHIYTIYYQLYLSLHLHQRDNSLNIDTQCCVLSRVVSWPMHCGSWGDQWTFQMSFIWSF